jgi:NitT/TauT family transport system ATP-binding protein
MNVIIFDKVGKTYVGDPRPALLNVSFSVEKGEFVCLVGASGCGKTTILKLIAGLDTPTSGALTKPERISMAFQAGALLPWLTVYDNVALGLRAQGAGMSEVERAVETELRAMGIAPLAQKYPHELSGGQRQRVGIARALAVDPEVLLLDEPFSALDAKTTAELHDDIIALWHRTGKTVVLVSHLIEEAVSLAQRVILVRDGAVDSIYPITLSYPRRESADFHNDVMKIRRAFFR